MNNYAIVFPGQGSQSIGMLSEFTQYAPVIQEVFTIVSDRLGYDLWALTQHGPEEQLNQTEHTQVAMLAADVAIFKIIQKLAPTKAKCMAGHSLGEYAALVAADAIRLADAAQLVANRGKLMQTHVPLGQGAMAAIVGLSDEKVRSICEQISTPNHEVTPANYNAIGQVVIAGHTAAIELAIHTCENEGAKLAKLIPVSVPCHCPLLKEAAEAFEEPLAHATFRTPSLAVISNVDLSIYESPKQIRNLLKQQLYCPVRWVETIQKMKTFEVEQVIESGPAKVLSGLIKRIDRTLMTTSINNDESLKEALRRITHVTTTG